MNSPNTVVETAPVRKEKKKIIALICCLLGGMVGAHKFYEEKYGMGLLYLITCGFFMIGVVIDLIKLLRMPSVYYVEPKFNRAYLEKLRSDIVNFPLDQAGRVIAIIGGGAAGLGISLSFHWTIIVIGLLVALAGMGLTWLKLRDVTDTLTFAGIPAAIAVVAVVAFWILLACVIVWLALKLSLGIDIVEWIMDIFGDDKKSGRSDSDFANHGPFVFPETIQDKQGNTYRLQHSSGDHADYYCPANGATMQVWESDFTSD